MARRKNREQKLVRSLSTKGYQKQAPIATDMFLPNVSAVREGLKRGPNDYFLLKTNPLGLYFDTTKVQNKTYAGASALLSFDGDVKTVLSADIVKFKNTITGGTFVLFNGVPILDGSYSNTLFQYSPTQTGTGSNYNITALSLPSRIYPTTVDTNFRGLSDGAAPIVTTAVTVEESAVSQIGNVIVQNAGGTVRRYGLNVNYSPFKIIGTMDVFGASVRGFGSGYALGGIVYAYYSNGGDWVMENDGTTGKMFFGGGKDVSLYYDATNFNIDTSLVAASDLNLQCGTDKTLELQETVWDDFVVPTSSIRLPSANPPTVTSYKSGQVLAFSSASDNYIYFVIQMPHKWKEGTDIDLHIHWTIPVSGVGGGAENVKWDATYSMANIAGSFPAASTGTATKDVQNDTADDHLLTDIVTIAGSGKTISNCIICSLKRDVSVANDYASNAYLVSVDVHHQIDTMGSRQELVK